ncbi:MFS transporter [Microlunatus sp. GCM10028923]|uniref:MFS transporter n=1 Tax=Microlunatus sp. GCM10028923 TaxID=3273400 RepID=UPI0036151F63
MTSLRTDATEPTAGKPRTDRVPHRWRNLATMTGVTVIDNGEGSVTTALFPTIAAALRLDSGALGLLSALGRLVAIPFGPFWVWLANRTSRRAALVISTSVGGVLALLSGFSQNFGQLVVLQTLQAGCVVGISPISNAVIADTFPDKNRGRATGYFYGITSLLGSFIAPVLGQLSGIPDGWRWGWWLIGGILILVGLLILVLFKEPKVGGADDELAGAGDLGLPKLRWQDALRLFRIPSFSLMLVSRLLSGHLLIGVFGVQFLVTERGFTNAVAAVVLLPFGIGYFLGTVGGGLTVSALDRLVPERGRIAYLQAAQVIFALVAFFGTQFDYASIGTYAIFWALMGAAQGLNPGVNRPIVMSVVLPELRAQAFVIFLAIFETIGWAAFSYLAGSLAGVIGIQSVFWWLLVVLMLINAAVITALYWVYPRDRARVRTELLHRREGAVGPDLR